MHEIEDLVFESVLAVDRGYPQDDVRVRDWLVALYAFQDRYDCSHTKGRVLDILIRRGHTYRFPLSEHPDYAARRDWFDSLADFTALRELDDEGPYDDWLEDGYVDPPWLYCEAGTALWKRLVDDPPPRPVPLIEAVLAVAETTTDPSLIAHWYGLGHESLIDGTPLHVDELAGDPNVIRLREIMDRTGAWSFELPDGYRPAEDELYDDLTVWWYAEP